MSDIYVYNNEFWKVQRTFNYVGAPEAFTLPPGEHLMICNGASGGHGNTTAYGVNHGATAIGIIDVQEGYQTFYAVVGGNGDDASTTENHGGYNGGGNGGIRSSSSYKYGACGGGSSDVRCSLIDDHIIDQVYKDIPEEYQPVEYIQSTGNERISLDVYPGKYDMEMDIQYIDNGHAQYQGHSSTVSTYFGITKSGLYSAQTTEKTTSVIPDTNGYERGLLIYHMRHGKNTTNLEYNNETCVPDSFGTASTTSKFVLFYHSSLSSYKTACKIWSIKVKNLDGETTHYFTPVQEKSSNKYGLYDLMNEKFYASETSTALTGGPNVEETHINVGIIDHGAYSLYTRIIVAAGGAGMINTASNEFPSQFGIGGGLWGCRMPNNNNDENKLKYASQTDGYKFFQGEGGLDYSSSDGAAGGGGGWYGGYTSHDFSHSTSMAKAGVGGSSFVLTSTSVLPSHYMVNSDKFLFTHPTCIGGFADSPSVIICQKVDKYDTGDKLICLPEGTVESFTLQPGQYKLKCWGGDGCPVNMIQSTSRGGYSEGTLTTIDEYPLYVHVGGSGIRHSDTYAEEFNINPSSGYNGGGLPFTDTNHLSTQGGGGTDIRIMSNSLYSRIIVAGGAGGHGSGEAAANRFGGAGGGVTGNMPNQIRGTVPGPGTQTESPYNSSVAVVCGDFGIGGNAYCRSSGYGGAGGGGWYGGSGCYPDSSSNDDAGGAGGSGYVLTAESFKPEGYLVDDEEFYLSDTTLTVGGNQLTIGQSKVEILVENVVTSKMLIQDEEGIKYYDNGEWKTNESLTEITPENIDTYGSYSFPSESGIVGEYDVYAHDEKGLITKMVYTVIPLKQHLLRHIVTENAIDGMSMDAEYDSSLVTIDSNITVESSTDMIDYVLDIGMDMTDIPIEDTRLYDVYTYSTKTKSSYHPPQEKHYLDHVDLLKVGTSLTIPRRNKEYMPATLDDETTVISSIQFAGCKELNREIYSFLYVNSTTFILLKLNLMNNTWKKIWELPKQGTPIAYVRDFEIDDEYVYVTSNNTHNLYRISIETKSIDTFVNGSTNETSLTALCNIIRIDSHTLLFTLLDGFMRFDTEKAAFLNPIFDDGIGTMDAYDSASNGITAIRSFRENRSSGVYNTCVRFNYLTGDDTDYYLTLSSNGRCCCAYDNGKYYVAQKGYMYIINANTGAIEKTIVSLSTLDPVRLYAEGNFLYILFNSNLLYMYNIRDDRFDILTLPFDVPSTSYSATQNIVRGCAIKHYFFIPYYKLFVTNPYATSKYNMGYKYNQHIYPINSSVASYFEYDDRFITLKDTYATINQGDIEYTFESYDEENNIFYTHIDRAYRSSIAIRIY